MMYMFYTTGGVWELSWEKLHRKAYKTVEEATEELKKHMVEKGCKLKNLQVWHGANPSKKSILEVRNRHKADENSFDDIPMTGYIIEIEV